MGARAGILSRIASLLEPRRGERRGADRRFTANPRPPGGIERRVAERRTRDRRQLSA